jgi:hypothetical protein
MLGTPSSVGLIDGYPLKPDREIGSDTEVVFCENPVTEQAKPYVRT